MKQIVFAVAAVTALVPSAASSFFKQQAQQCSAAEWIWDTLVSDLGCTVHNR